MVAAPVAIPVTTPLPDPTAAIVGLLLIHTPPLMLLVSVVVAPEHILVAPLIGADAFTVITAVAAQPAGVRYVIVTLPPAIPDNTPVAEPIVATPVLLLLQVPPPIPLIRAVVAPTHTLLAPVIADKALTVIPTLALQPAPVL